ncbi:hypothetical protein HK102_004356, partial [Quaeritorhiza haematococci]
EVDGPHLMGEDHLLLTDVARVHQAIAGPHEVATAAAVVPLEGGMTVGRRDDGMIADPRLQAQSGTGAVHPPNTVQSFTSPTEQVQLYPLSCATRKSQISIPAEVLPIASTKSTSILSAAFCPGNETVWNPDFGSPAPVAAPVVQPLIATTYTPISSSS